VTWSLFWEFRSTSRQYPELMIFKYINIVRRNNMLITLGTASEYVSQNLSNERMVSRQWLKNPRKFTTVYTLNWCFAGLCAFKKKRNGFEIYLLYAREIRQLQHTFKCIFISIISDHITSRNSFMKNRETVNKAVFIILLKTTGLKS